VSGASSALAFDSMEHYRVGCSQNAHESEPQQWNIMVALHAGLLVELTAELVRRSSKNNAIIVTWASSAYLDFLRNWVHWITSWDVDNILIGIIHIQLIPLQLRSRSMDLP